MARILIFGGHGKVALLLEPMLVAQGHTVTAVIRDSAQEAEVAATGAQPVVADVEILDLAQLTNLVAGNDVVVWSAGAGGGSPTRTYAVDRDAAVRSMDAAAAAGVLRYVMVSWIGSRADHGVARDSSFFAYADAKWAADAHLAQQRAGLDDPRAGDAHPRSAHRAHRSRPGGRRRGAARGRGRGDRRDDRRRPHHRPHHPVRRRRRAHRARDRRLSLSPRSSAARAAPTAG